MLARDVVRRSFPDTPLDNIVGQSESTLQLHEFIETVAPTDEPVLIVGETGTGKELVARAIHGLSRRRDRPFVAVNCLAVADALWESEIFGHEKGAFTGAVATKRGRFELADRGTFFFDEISGASLALQGKLLRVLQELEFERLGGTTTLRVDVRFVAAANKDPAQGVLEGWFRPDLLYRLNVVTIELPALRNNREDIPLLIDHFLLKYAWQNRKNVTGLSTEAFEVLMDYFFPGNTRELENIIKRAIILTKERRITVQDLPKELTKGPRTGPDGHPYQRVNGDKLLDALKSITISDNGGGPKRWHSSLKCVSIETIHEFLLRTYRREFSRLEFTRFLDHKSGSDRNKYGTAGKYLAILRDSRICVHNEKKANQSRFRLAEAFVGDA